MAGLDENYPKVSKQDPILAKDWNAYGEAIGRLNSLANGQDGLSNSVGVFPHKKNNRLFVQGRLSTALSACGTATLQVYEPGTFNAGTAAGTCYSSAPALAPTGETLTIRDRHGFSAVSGKWCTVVNIGYEWLIICLEC